MNSIKIRNERASIVGKFGFVVVGRAEADRNVAGDVIAADRDNGRIAERPVVDDGDVGGAAPDVHHGDAQVALILGERCD